VNTCKLFTLEKQVVKSLESDKALTKRISRIDELGYKLLHEDKELSSRDMRYLFSCYNDESNYYVKMLAYFILYHHFNHLLIDRVPVDIQFIDKKHELDAKGYEIKWDI